MEKKTIAVLGMMCAGCAANVERRLGQLEGIASASVNFAAGTVLVEYDKNKIAPQVMKDELIKIGYDMIIDDEQSAEEIEKKSYRSSVRKTAVSWCLAILVMCISMGWLNVGNNDNANLIMMITALAGIIYCGRDFYTNAWKQLMHRMANMDTLVAMSTGISFIFSVFNTFWGEQFWGTRGIPYHTYYDASVMIISFVLTGRMLEERAKNGTASAIRALMGLAPKTARTINDKGQGMKVGGPDEGVSYKDVPIGELNPGDIIEVRAGEKIPVDGSAIGLSAEETARNRQKSGISLNPFIDESMVSGEPAPVMKKDGDKVYAGTIVKQGRLVFKAEEVGSKTMLANIIRMVQEAQGSKAPVQRVVDRIALLFVPAVLGISIVTFLLWWLIGGNAYLPQGILSAISVLVIACPCAMGLATPTALMVGIGKAAQKNILIKDAAALENIRNVNALVIDKTGTLTIPAETGFVADNRMCDATACNPPATSCQSGVDTVAGLESKETLKPYAREAIQMLRQRGIEIYMMSGDKEEAVRYWAERAGIKNYRSRVMPQDKEDMVRRLQGEGRHVAMVGDGINDTQALAAADVSIAMGKGTDIAMDVAQVTLIGTDLRRIPDAIRLSAKTVGMIHQNLFWAFIYNVISIPLAAGLPYLLGMQWQITPMWASALMAFSSVSVVLNSLRLKIMC